MGLISDFFSSFSRSGAQVTADIQSVAQRGRVVRRAPTTRPRTRREAIHRARQRVVSTVDQLSRTKQVQFINTQATRIDQAIKRETKARIPTLRDIQMAGYKYGKKNPEAARLIYGSGTFGAGVVRKAIPTDIGVPVGQAMHAFSDGAIKGVRNEPVKTLAFLALPGAVGAVMKGAKYIPIASKIVKSEKAMKAAAYGFDIVYSHNVYTRVNAPVVSYYKDGKVLSETSKTMPDGSIQITQQIEQLPVMRKPNTNEKSERLGYIFSTEAGPMVFGAMGIQKVSKVRFKELSKKGVKTTKQTVKKLKKPGDIKKYIKKTKELKDIKKRHEAVRKRITKAEAKTAKEKVQVLEVKKGKLKLLKKTRAQLKKAEAKAKKKELAAIRKRLKKVDKDIKKAEKAIKKEKVLTTVKTKKGEKLKVTTKGKLEKAKAKAKAKELKDIKKRHAKVKKEVGFKQAFQPSKKVVKLSNSTYNNISRLSKLKAKLKALATKIRNIPASVAKRIGLNKTKEIQKINILMRETDAVKSYIIMIQKGASRKVVVAHLSKLSETKLQVIDTKTGKTIKTIESTTKDIELKIKPSEKIDFKVTKPSKKPSTEYKEVKESDGMVQLQKVKEIQKSVTETIKITKADMRAAEKMKAEMKAIVKTKPKTKVAVRTKHRKLQKVNTKIKSRQKQLLIYRRQLRESKTKLKQRRTILIALVGKMKPVEKTRTRRIILIIPRYIDSIDDAIAQITRTTELVAPVIIPADEIIPKPRIRITPVHKPIPKEVPVPIIKPVLLLPKKTPTKKKKKRKKKGVKEAYVTNPVPSLKAFLG